MTKYEEAIGQHDQACILKGKKGESSVRGCAHLSREPVEDISAGTDDG